MCSLNIDVNNVCWSWFTDSKITQQPSNEWSALCYFYCRPQNQSHFWSFYCWTCVRLPEWTVNLPLNLLCLSEFQSDIYSTGSVIRPTSNKPMTGKEWRHPSRNMTCNTDVISPASCWLFCLLFSWFIDWFTVTACLSLILLIIFIFAQRSCTAASSAERKLAAHAKGCAVAMVWSFQHKTSHNLMEERWDFLKCNVDNES